MKSEQHLASVSDTSVTSSTASVGRVRRKPSRPQWKIVRKDYDLQTTQMNICWAMFAGAVITGIGLFLGWALCHWGIL